MTHAYIWSLKVENRGRAAGGRAVPTPPFSPISSWALATTSYLHLHVPLSFLPIFLTHTHKADNITNTTQFVFVLGY